MIIEVKFSDEKMQRVFGEQEIVATPKGKIITFPELVGQERRSWGQSHRLDEGETESLKRFREDIKDFKQVEIEEYNTFICVRGVYTYSHSISNGSDYNHVFTHPNFGKQVIHNDGSFV